MWLHHELQKFKLWILISSMRGDTKIAEIMFWMKVMLLVIQVSLSRRVFYEPIFISVPAAVVVRGWVWLQWIFLKTLATCLPILWWVIYKCTECSAVFDQKSHYTRAPLSWDRPGMLWISLSGLLSQCPTDFGLLYPHFICFKISFDFFFHLIVGSIIV